MPKTLFILNDPPYGTERSYNALRLAGALAKREAEEVKVFPMDGRRDASCSESARRHPGGRRGSVDVPLNERQHL